MIGKIANYLKKSDTGLAKKIFDAEYAEQMLNYLEKGMQEFQEKTSKELTPWMKKRFDDYHVQRYIDMLPENERKNIKEDVEKLSHKYLMAYFSGAKKNLEVQKHYM